MKSTLNHIVPVLPTDDLDRDEKWYDQMLGFKKVVGDKSYGILLRDRLELHLQWHADTDDDPLMGGSVIRIFVDDIEPIVDEMVERGTIDKDKLRKNTPWGTHEFGVYDPNGNAIFFVQDV